MPFVPIDKKHAENLAISAKVVGPIYPVIKSDRSGRIVSGEHRLNDYPDWPVEIRHYKNDFEEEAVRIEANTQRQVSETEQKLRFKHLAEATVKDKGVEPSKVCAFLIHYFKGRYTERWIEHLLDEEWKGPQGPKKTEVTSVSTLQALETAEDNAEETKKICDKLSVRTSESQPTAIMDGCLCPTCPNKTMCY